MRLATNWLKFTSTIPLEVRQITIPVGGLNKSMYIFGINKLFTV
jgi:hypothetical protein